MVASEGLRLPASTSLTYVRCRSARSASFSWEIPKCALRRLISAPNRLRTSILSMSSAQYALVVHLVLQTMSYLLFQRLFPCAYLNPFLRAFKLLIGVEAGVS